MEVAEAERPRTDVASGLSATEVAQRVQAGLVNVVETSPSRSLGEIIRANVFTYFNGLIATLTVLVLVFGSPRDALFGLVAVINVVIGVVQELRAKHTLDSLALLNAPKAKVVRDGRQSELEVEAVVLDDILCLGIGDQVVVDGIVCEADGLSIDESLLTGESDPVAKQPGDEVLSGSFVVAGSGRFQATRVGDQAYAAKLAAEAKRFTLVRSELRDGISTILRIITVVMVPVGLMLLAGQLWRADLPFAKGIVRTVAGLVGMIPEGLVLLTSVAMAVAVVRLGRRKTLVQELAAVEGLARVDTVCLDKTGTLTQGGIDLDDIEYVGTMPEHDARAALAAFAHSDENPNPTQQAIAEALAPPDEPWPVQAMVPFSSARKWSSVTFAPGPSATFVFGAPDVILAGRPPDDPVRLRTTELAATGRRVLLFARASAPPVDETLPDDIDPVALVTLAEQLRPDARETLAYFQEQDVAIKVISGDNPVTVAAVAREVGVPDADHGIDARTLPDDLDELADQLEQHAVFGRVQPQQKQSMVRALQSHGHTVAMTGDGVNDVLALKDADIGVAMGSGSPASRAVAQLVLLDGRYTSLPLAVAEGRRVIANIERVATLFLVKNAYAATLAILSFIAAVEFPFLPRHLTLVNAITIGIPGFFLSLAPAAERAQTGFVRRVLLRSVPAGVIAGLAVFSVFAITLGDLSLRVTDESKRGASSVAVAALLTIGLFIVYLVARPITKPRLVLLTTLIGMAVLAFSVPFVRDYFDLDLPDEVREFEGLLVIPPAVVALELAWRWTNRWIDGRAAQPRVSSDGPARSAPAGSNGE